MTSFKKGLLVLLAVALVGCKAEVSKESVEKVIKENPEIITKAIEENPVIFIEAFQKAAQNARDEMKKKQEDDEKKKLEAYFTNPLKPEIRNDESFLGPKDAPITLVEYSDFECPYCSRGYQTVKQLMEKYNGKIKFVYKHLPLSFHKQAMIASQYYEAIRLQDADKAFKFHDAIFENQRSLQNGEAFLKETAKGLGVNMTKLQKDVNSDAVKKRIAQDMQEAKKFGMQGTPGFIINGIPVRGAYPADYFSGLINQMVEKGTLKL